MARPDMLDLECHFERIEHALYSLRTEFDDARSLALADLISAHTSALRVKASALLRHRGADRQTG